MPTEEEKPPFRRILFAVTRCSSFFSPKPKHVKVRWPIYGRTEAYNSLLWIYDSFANLFVGRSNRETFASILRCTTSRDASIDTLAYFCSEMEKIEKSLELECRDGKWFCHVYYHSIAYFHFFPTSA
jgi:hypothetical protein